MVDMIINGVCIAWTILGITAIAAVIIDLFGGNKDEHWNWRTCKD